MSKVPQADKYIVMYRGGDHHEARRQATRDSVRMIDDWDRIATILVFEDGSAIYDCAPEFRPATQFDIKRASGGS